MRSTATPSPTAGRGVGRLAFQLLGPLRVWRDGVEIDTGPRQQSYLLTLLLMRAGRPVSASELVDLMWDDEMPSSAINIVQKYVGSLRHLLEPDLPARASGSFIQRRSSGYQLDLGSAALDLAEFRQLLAQARGAMAAGRVEDGVSAYDQALSRWRGSAGDGLALSANAAGLFAALNAELLDACVEASEAAVPHGQAKRILQPLRLAAWFAPLDESVQAALVTTLAAAGLQAEALSVVESTRARLDEELGIEPGRLLREAHEQVLRHTDGDLLTRPGALLPDVSDPDPPPAAVGKSGLVGRRQELALLRHSVDSATLARAQIVIVEGPPGAGKTRLLSDLVEEADAAGAVVAWGRCPHVEGTPSMWPWIKIVETLLDTTVGDERASWTVRLRDLLEPEDQPATLPDLGAQRRMFSQVIELLRAVAAQDALVVVVDDLHWADQPSLDLFAHLADELPDRCVLVGCVRDSAPVPPPRVVQMLAAAARQQRHRRFTLGPLEPDEVAELVERETGQAPSPEVARSIQARTGGNPLFARELARFLADSDRLSDAAFARAAVPSTVRDIVDERMSRISDPERRLIEAAALIGRDVDVRLLAHAARVELPRCIARLESLSNLGLVQETPGPPVGWRFTHELVREAVARSAPRAEAGELHLRIADGLAAAQGSTHRHAVALAHHLVLAGAFAEPERTAQALLDAGRVSAARTFYDVAEEAYDLAAGVAHGAGLTDIELTALSELTAVAGIRSGWVGTTLDHVDRAEELARSLGREREATGFLFSRFLAHAQGIQVDAAGRFARRLLDQGQRSSDAVVQASGHHAWGVYQWSTGDINEACRYLARSHDLIQAGRDTEPLQRRLRLLTPVMLALNTALRGDLGSSKKLFDQVRDDAGHDAYALSIWGSFAVTAAAVAGDVEWARGSAQAAIDADPDHSFTFSGAYPRLAAHWADGMCGDPADAATQVEHLIDTALADPPRSNLATWHALRGELLLAAGDPAGAMTALDRAESVIETYGERYAQGLVLVLRAQALEASGAPTPVVRSAEVRALQVCHDRGALIFTTRTPGLNLQAALEGDG